MIKINLALRKQSASVASEEKAGGLSALKGVKLDSDTLRELPLRKIAGVIAVGFAANFGLGEHMSSEMAVVEQELSAQQVTLNQLRQKANLANQLLAVKAQLEGDEKTLRTKIDTIRNLIADRENPPKMLRALSQSLPENLWIDDFQTKGSEVTFVGAATDFTLVSDFMRNLGESAYFDSVELKSTENRKLGAVDVKLFSVRAARK